MRPATSPGSGRLTPTIPAPSPTPWPRGPTPNGASHSPTHMADRSHTDAPAPDHHRGSTGVNSPPDHHPVHRKPVPTTDRRTVPRTDRRTVRVTDRGRARPASLRLAYPTRPGPSALRSWRAAAVIMRGRRPRTGPPPGLRHLVEIRHATCTYPGCRRPATHCDADHTVAYHRGGRTCLCNLAPLCRRHHRAKQAPGWHLTQDQPGVMTWRLPSGRIYQTAGDP